MSQSPVLKIRKKKLIYILRSGTYFINRNLGKELRERNILRVEKVEPSSVISLMLEKWNFYIILVDEINWYCWIRHFKSFKMVYNTSSFIKCETELFRKLTKLLFWARALAQKRTLYNFYFGSWLLSLLNFCLYFFSPQMFRSRNLLRKFLLLK